MNDDLVVGRCVPLQGGSYIGLYRKEPRMAEKKAQLMAALPERDKDNATARRVIEFLEKCGIRDIQDAVCDFREGASPDDKAYLVKGLIKALAEPHDPSVLDDDQ